MQELLEKMPRFSGLLLRAGLAFVFIWFGSQQLLDSSAWAGLIPEWIVSMSGMSALTFVFLNGLFEVVFGLALLVGFFTRTVALLLGLHLLGIAFTVGYNDVGVRDFGLAMATFAVFLEGSSIWSVDEHLEKRSKV